jgi:hypothetical protein
LQPRRAWLDHCNLCFAMHSSQLVALLAAVTAVFLVTVPARAEIVSIERLLLPSDVADRVEGSGAVCASLVASDGARYNVDIASLRLRMTTRLSLRAGIGMARLRLSSVLPETAGPAFAGGVTVAVWQGYGYSVAVTASALRASPPDRRVADATLLLTFGTPR